MVNQYHIPDQQSNDQHHTLKIDLEFRGRLRQVSWDLDFFQRPKTITLIRLHGSLGVHVYLSLISWLSLECSCLSANLESLREWCEANQFDKEQVKPILKYLVDKEILQEKHGKYWSNRLFFEATKFAKRVRNKELMGMLAKEHARLSRP